MGAVSEQRKTVAKFGAHQISEKEKRAVECFAALQKAEQNFKPGIEFGEAMIELRNEIEASGGRNWIARLKQLRITYEKARYWMNVVEGNEDRNRRAKKEEPAPRQHTWETATAEFKPLADAIIMLKQREPLKGGDIVGKLHSLVDAFGYRLVVKSEDVLSAAAARGGASA
jgi:hypothetical protein